MSGMIAEITRSAELSRLSTARVFDGTLSGAQASLAGENALPSDGWRMVSEDLRRTGLERLIAERGDQLMAAAIALSGTRESAEDLLQAAFERLVRNWRRVSSDPEAYIRRILYNLAADGWRQRGRWRRALPVLVTHAGPAADPADAVGLRDAVAGLMQQLPPRQRAVLLLRYWEQLSEAETAAVLGCAEGTVKSAASRGLARLRELTETWPEAGAARRPPRPAITEGDADA